MSDTGVGRELGRFVGRWKWGLIVLVGLVVVAGFYFTGVSQDWEGAYSGIVRPSGAPGSLSILKDTSGKADVILVLNTPELKQGRCTISFHRSDREMRPAGGFEKCSGPIDYSIDHGSSMKLDGSNLYVMLSMRPSDLTREVRFEFIGKRDFVLEPRLPPLFPKDCHAVISKCSAQWLKCGQDCPSAGPPGRGMTEEETATWEAAMATDKRCNEACNEAKHKCEAECPTDGSSTSAGK